MKPHELYIKAEEAIANPLTSLGKIMVVIPYTGQCGQRVRLLGKMGPLGDFMCMNTEGEIVACFEEAWS
ncbi:MAG TPA: hypothetical protein V6C86_24285 [Oculatellaceae cyanobacterium]